MELTAKEEGEKKGVNGPEAHWDDKSSMELNLLYWKWLFYYCLNLQHLNEMARLEQHGFSLRLLNERLY